MQEEIIVGIDLGTTNSEIAIVENGQSIVIKDNDRNILPSFVGISENNEILIGEPARNQYILYPERTIKSIKREMGTEIKVPLGEEEYSPQEISAMILKRLKTIAENYLKKPVNKAVITVPAYFSDAQRQATRDAGKIAGLEVVRIINEPTAAALSYEAEQKDHKKILVYDLGGGTFDVSVVGVESDVVEVISSHGNNHLGGDDFDQKIIDYILEHIQEKHKIDLKTERRALARIARAAETAKCKLSDQPYVMIEEEYLHEKKGKPIHLSLELSREYYEHLIENYISETLDAVHKALSDANLTASDIDEILLVGGSTRTPVISERLRTEFKQHPHGEIDPDLCVAKGAAVQAAMLAGQSVSSVLVDITPYTFGTSSLGEFQGELYPYVFCPIIHKNTPLPASKSEVFYTIRDGQKRVEINIYQGDDPDALNNIKIGEFMVEGLSDVPANNPIIVKLDLDLDGILHVSAIEKCTGLQKSIEINNAFSNLEDNELNKAKERLKGLFGEEWEGIDTTKEEIEEAEIIHEEKKQHHTIVHAKALLEKTERLMETDKITADDREDLINLTESVQEAIQKENFETLETLIGELSDIIYYLDT